MHLSLHLMETVAAKMDQLVEVHRKIPHVHVKADSCLLAVKKVGEIVSELRNITIELIVLGQASTCLTIIHLQKRSKVVQVKWMIRRLRSLSLGAIRLACFALGEPSLLSEEPLAKPLAQLCSVEEAL